MSERCSCSLICQNNAAAGWQLPLDRPSLKALLERMGDIAAPGASFTLILTDDREIADLNARYLGCNGPTNIITFPCSDTEPGLMYLSLDCFWRECLIYAQEGREHFLHLLAHGFGHLAGLDHGPEMDLLSATCEEAGFSLFQPE